MRESESPTVRRPPAGPVSDAQPDAPTTRTRSRRRTQVLLDRPLPPDGEAALVLDRYRLQKRLGSGAFGTVWAARDERLEREVAVKIVPRERVVGGRFEREARAAARLAHPAIVTLYEAAIDDDGAYLVSELVRGGTLTKALDAGKLSDTEILQIGITLCDALSHAHAESVIHRDVKPSNILLPGPSGRAATRARPPAAAAKLTDFGVARVLGGDSLTRTGDVLGTAAYMAPEQAEGRNAGPEADLYSLALVLYEALTGVNPVRTSVSAIRARRLGAHLPPLRRQRRDLPRELGAGIDLALRPRPRERGTLEELSRALEVSAERTSDERGVVAEPWRPARLPTLIPGRNANNESDGDAQLWTPSARQAPAQAESPPELDFDHSVPAVVPRSLRAAATIAGAAIAFWPATLGLLPTQIPVAGYALLGGLLTLAAPLAGYVALTILLTGALLAAGNSGAALVILAVLMIGVLLLPGRGLAWPLPAGAVALGILGLAGAWPAAAARIGGSAWRRAALAAAGIPWLAAAAELAGHGVFINRKPHAPSPIVWTNSLQVTFHEVIGQVANPGVLATAAVWGLAAAVLPKLARGRPTAFELIAVIAWAAILASATLVALALGGRYRVPTAEAATLGTIAAAAVALWPALMQARREARTGSDPSRAEPGLP
ncbi:MAG: serine/threonine-protein kinase [Solirubrobacteraceae bacterium]